MESRPRQLGPSNTHAVQVVGDERYRHPTQSTELIMPVKVLNMNCHYAVADPSDNIVFKVKRDKFKISITNAAGEPILWAAFGQIFEIPWEAWEVYSGSEDDTSRLLFTTMKSQNQILCATMLRFLASNASMNVYLASNANKTNPDFKVKGANMNETKLLFFRGAQVIAEVQRFDHTVPPQRLPRLLIERYSFLVTIYPGVDQAFIVALILIVDEIGD